MVGKAWAFVGGMVSFWAVLLIVGLLIAGEVAGSKPAAPIDFLAASVRPNGAGRGPSQRTVQTGVSTGTSGARFARRESRRVQTVRQDYRDSSIAAV